MAAAANTKPKMRLVSREERKTLFAACGCRLPKVLTVAPCSSLPSESAIREPKECSTHPRLGRQWKGSKKTEHWSNRRRQKNSKTGAAAVRHAPWKINIRQPPNNGAKGEKMRQPPNNGAKGEKCDNHRTTVLKEAVKVATTLEEKAVSPVQVPQKWCELLSKSLAEKKTVQEQSVVVL